MFFERQCGYKWSEIALTLGITSNNAGAVRWRSPENPRSHPEAQSKEVVLNWKRRTVMRLSRREETRLLKAATRVLLEG
jgi:hypothetical protein